jgi:hypothetical protein
MERLCKSSEQVLQFEGWLLPTCKHKSATSWRAYVMLSASEASRSSKSKTFRIRFAKETLWAAWRVW